MCWDWWEVGGEGDVLCVGVCDVVDYVDYICWVVGVCVVGIGVDYDGFDVMLEGFEDVFGYLVLFVELCGCGWMDDDFVVFVYENVLCVLEVFDKDYVVFFVGWVGEFLVVVFVFVVDMLVWEGVL